VLTRFLSRLLPRLCGNNRRIAPGLFCGFGPFTITPDPLFFNAPLLLLTP
jgi:hypothetical protein